MSQEKKSLSEQLVLEIREAGRRYTAGEIDYQHMTAKFLEGHAVVRAYKLANDIAGNAKTAPPEHLLEYAGIK